MKIVKSVVLPVLLATVWISVSEFLRNEILFKSYWISHYQSLGLVFPSEPINGMVWGIWSLCFAIVIYVLSKKFSLWRTVLLSFFAGFVLMWLVIVGRGTSYIPPVKHFFDSMGRGTLFNNLIDKAAD